MALFNDTGGAVCTMLREGAVRVKRINALLLGVSMPAFASPVRAEELAPTAGQGSTLMVVVLVTLVLAALVFGLFQWLDAAQSRNAGLASDTVDVAPSADLGPGDDLVPARQKLALVPENPMLDALSRKQDSANIEQGDDAADVLDPSRGNGQLAAAQ